MELIRISLAKRINRKLDTDLNSESCSSLSSNADFEILHTLYFECKHGKMQST